MSNELTRMVTVVQADVARRLTENWLAGRGKPTRERLLAILKVRRDAALQCGDLDVCVVALYVLEQVERHFDGKF